MLQDYLGDGSRLGIRIEYAAQPKPEGIAQAFLHRRRFSRRLRRVAHSGRQHFLRETRLLSRSARDRTGRVHFRLSGARSRALRRGRVRPDGRAISLEEKPKQPKSNFAIPGLYVYDERVVEFCRSSAAVGARRTRDHRSQFGLSQAKRAAREVAGPRDGVARHRNANQLARSRQLHRDDRTSAGLEDRLPGGSRVSHGFINEAQLERIVDGLPKGEYREYLRLVCAEGTSAIIQPRAVRTDFQSAQAESPAKLPHGSDAVG